MSTLLTTVLAVMAIVQSAECTMSVREACASKMPPDADFTLDSLHGKVRRQLVKKALGQDASHGSLSPTTKPKTYCAVSSGPTLLLTGI